MATSKAQQKATAKYIKNAYDRIDLKLPKGEKEKIKLHADKKNESVNAFISRAISETIKRETE
jgi:predicted HicB family RNase H-like nuclease